MEIIKKITRKLSLYFNYPNQLKADYYTLLNKPKARKLGVQFLEPNYIYLNNFNDKSIVVDVGCGFLAEFSCMLIEKYKLKSYCIDPTLKHQPQLKELENKYGGHIHYVPVAITSKDGKIKFYETLDHESGSVMSAHTNVIKDNIRSYDVESLTLPTLLKTINHNDIDLLKLDLEGAEFELLENISKPDLDPFRQLFIEFHHLSVKGIDKSAVKKIIKRIESFGYKSFSLDRINYLFYK